MDDSHYQAIAALVGLLVLHALVVMSANALAHARQSPLRDRAQSGDARAKRTLALIDTPARLTVTTQFTLTLLKSFFIALAVLIFISAYAAFDARFVPSTGLALMLVALAFAAYIVGELVPATLGRAFSDPLAGPVTRLVEVLATVLTPFVWIFLALDRALARLGRGGDDLSKAIIEGEIIDLVEASEREGVLEDDERNMIKSVLEFDETMVREIMVPRVDISAIDISAPPREAIRMIIESGHSRIPVFQEEIDDIRGLLYAKDLLSAWYNGELERRTLQDLMRPAYFVPETKRAEDLFREFQTSNTQLAIVVDEFGSTAGVISIEDIVEEIVGDIRDEYDTTEAVEWVRLGENEYAVDASINLYDFNRYFETDLPSDESDSLGGYLYERFGQVPEVGAELETEGLRLRVESVEGVRIRRVHVQRIVPPPEPSASAPTDTAEVRPARLDPRGSEA